MIEAMELLLLEWGTLNKLIKIGNTNNVLSMKSGERKRYEIGHYVEVLIRFTKSEFIH